MYDMHEVRAYLWPYEHIYPSGSAQFTLMKSQFYITNIEFYVIE